MAIEWVYLDSQIRNAWSRVVFVPLSFRIYHVSMCQTEAYDHHVDVEEWLERRGLSLCSLPTQTFARNQAWYRCTHQWNHCHDRDHEVPIWYHLSSKKPQRGQCWWKSKRFLHCHVTLLLILYQHARRWVLPLKVYVWKPMLEEKGPWRHSWQNGWFECTNRFAPHPHTPILVHRDSCRDWSRIPEFCW